MVKGVVPFGFFNTKAVIPPAEHGYMAGTGSTKTADRLDFNTETVTGVATAYFFRGVGGAGHDADNAYTWVNSNFSVVSGNPAIIHSRLNFASFTMATAGGTASYGYMTADCGIINNSTYCNFLGYDNVSSRNFRATHYIYSSNTANTISSSVAGYDVGDYRGGRMMYPSDGTALGTNGSFRAWSARDFNSSTYTRFDSYGGSYVQTVSNGAIYTVPQDPIGMFRRCGNTPFKGYNQSQNSNDKFNNAGVEFTFSTQTTSSTYFLLGQPFGDSGAVYNDIYMYSMRGQEAGGSGAEVWRFTFNTTTAAINLGSLCSSTASHSATFMDLDGSIL